MFGHTLKDCISTLKELRNTYQSQLDTRDAGELEKVIRDLETLDSSKGIPRSTASRALVIIAKVIATVSNINDLM